MKKIRLENPAYSQQGAYCLITICTENRLPVFNDAEFVQICTDTLKNLAEKSQFTLIVYYYQVTSVAAFEFAIQEYINAGEHRRRKRPL